MKTDILYTSPCVIFCLSEMFETPHLQRCFEEFPLDKALYKSDQNGKHRVEHFSREMAKIHALSDVWRSTFKRLASDDVLQMLSKLERAEGSMENSYAWEALNPLSNFINRYAKQKTLVRQSLEFSLLSDGASLVPHTDSRNKLITMMMYFPEPQQENRRNLGTTFHDFSPAKKSGYENFDNHHYTAERFPDFYADHDAFFQTSFVSGKAYGFMKNAHSWHSVTPISLKDGEHRRSLNINVYRMNQSIFAPLWAAFKRKIKVYV